MDNLKRLLCTVMAVLIFISAPVVSYLEARAVEVLGGIALVELLEGLLVTAGVASVGYVTIREGQDMKEKQELLERAMLTDARVAAALEDAAEWERTVGGHTLSDGYSYVSDRGFKITNVVGSNAGDGINIALDPSLITAVRDIAKSWADSEANNVKVAADSDKAGTEKVDFQYMSSITTTIKSIPTVDSMEDMDAMFGIDGAFGYFRSQGYSDTSYYWLIQASGSSTIFVPIPYGYSVIGAKTSYLGRESVCILSNTNYKNAIVQNGMRDSSSFYSYFWALPSYIGRYHTYNHKTASWTVTERNFSPSIAELSGRYTLSNWYTCGYKDAYSDGSIISYNFFSSSLSRIIYTYDSVGKYFTYDYSKAPSIPDEGYEFLIPVSDYAGFKDTELAALVPYISSLSATLKDLLDEQEKNQEELIQQGKDTLEAINNMHTTVGKIYTISDKILAAINKIISLLNPAAYVTAFAKKFMTADSLTELLNSLPKLFADASVLPLTSVIEAIDAIPESLVTGLALPDVIRGAIASVFPRVHEVEDAIIEFPDIIAGALSGVVIEIPDIQIPEITIPDEITITKLDISELSVPAMANPTIDLTLNPSYDITVTNDYTGLTDIISSAVDGVLTDLFVPDEALAMEKVAEMEAYFKFKDGIITGVIDLKTMLYSINPSPILKIPIGKPTSKKYNYGTGNYIIIDVSWYAPYKQLGDKIILAIAWALFLWHMFLKLPGIISGTEGSIVSMDKSYQRYEIVQKSKKR